jgi:hypothetical protein
MFPEVPEISGKKLVPQLGIGCFFFTMFGLLGTWLVATAVTSYMHSHPSTSSPHAREVQDR